MKILHIYRLYYPDTTGGVLEVIRQVCHATKRLGASTGIFALSPHSRQRRLSPPEAWVERSRSYLEPASCNIGGLDAFRTYRKLAAEADLLHFHYPWPFADLMYLLGAVERPAVLTYHSDIVRQSAIEALYAPLRNRFLARMSAIIATSPAYARSSPILHALSDRSRIVTIPLGMAEPDCLASGTPAESGPDAQPYFLFLGALRYYKGLRFLIEAARLSGLRVVIAGEGPERPELEREAGDLPHVSFLGAVSESRKYALIRSARALVLPSHLRSEAFGMTLLEAAACSVPMISCEIGTGTTYANIHEVTGLVVPAADSPALAAAMRRLADDAEWARLLGQGARLRYDRLFSERALGDATMRLYRNVLGGLPAGAGIDVDAS